MTDGIKKRNLKKSIALLKMWLLLFYKAIARESDSQVSLSHNEQAQKIKMSNNIELTLSSAPFCVHRAHML